MSSVSIEMPEARDVTSRHPDDAGLTLIELIVYIALLTIVLVIVGGFLINSMKTGRDVRVTTEASTSGQLISRSIQAGVRNASAIKLVIDSDGGELVVVRTSTTGATQGWVCQAWYYSPATKAMYTKRTDPASAITLPSGGPDGMWTKLGSGVTPVTGSASGQVFEVSAWRVNLNLEVTAGDRSPILIQTAANTRTETSESAPCF